MTLYVIDNGYEKRFYFSDGRLAEGMLGWLSDGGEVVVYRRDVEATERLRATVPAVREVAARDDTFASKESWRAAKQEVVAIIGRAMEGGDEMGIVKHGVGEVLPDEGDAQKTAGTQDWSPADDAALAQENAAADGKE